MNPTHSAEHWFERYPSRVTARLRLVCLPYAGGRQGIYSGWSALLPPNIEHWSALLPGHEIPVNETSLMSFENLVQHLTNALALHLDIPVALFGHSMGAILAFEMARELRRRGLEPPVYLFVSGHAAPQQPPLTEPIHDLPDDEFLKHIRDFNGTPDEVLQHAELMQLMLPILRADFKMFEEYQYVDEGPLGCPLSAFGGSQDVHTSPEQLEAWRQQTLGEFRLRMFNGGHFYLNQMRPALIQALSYDLAPFLK
jgi:medium-chain acyl-[acyl-carrier-protein] hydrolase